MPRTFRDSGAFLMKVWADSYLSGLPSFARTNIVLLSILMDGCDMKALISFKVTRQRYFYALRLCGPGVPNAEIACFWSLADAKTSAERMVTLNS